jgi:hypothetical protein
MTGWLFFVGCYAFALITFLVWAGCWFRAHDGEYRVVGRDDDRDGS